MKIAITSTGDTLESEVDPRFGRAQKFILYDTEDSSFVVMDNQKNLELPSGAGVQTSQNIVESKAQVLISGNCGPRAFAILSTAGIKIFIGAEGKVKDAIQLYKEGKLKEVDQANVEGHWM